MTKTEIEKSLHAYAEAKNARDVDAVLELVTDDGWYESIGLGTRIQGKEALRDFYEALFAALPDYHGDFESVAIGEDTAVVWGSFGGTVAGNFMGLPATRGNRVAVPVAFVCTFRHGLVASDAGYFDVATLAEQAGIRDRMQRPAAGDKFVTRFADFWRAPDPALLPKLVHADVRADWSGVDEEITGLDGYQEHFRNMLAAAPDLQLDVLDHMAEGDRVLIQWRAHCTIAGQPLEFDGVDHFRLRDGLAYQATVVFDNSPVQKALAAAS